MRLFRIFIIQLWLLLGFIPATATEPTTELLPEVKTILTLPPFEESWLENNIHPEMLAFLMPKSNIIKAGKRAAKIDYDTLKERLNDEIITRDNINSIEALYTRETGLKHPFIDYLATWTYPIKSFDKREPLGKKILEDLMLYKKQDLLENFDEYKEVFTRYKNLSTHKAYRVIPHYYSNYGLHSGEITKYSHSYLEYALIIISEGKVKEGLDIFEREYDFIKMLVSGEKNHALRSAELLLPLETIYSTMEDLVRSKIIKGNDLSHSFFRKVQEPLFSDEVLTKHLDDLIQRDFERKIRQLYVSLFTEDKNDYTFEFPWGIYNREKFDNSETLNLMYQYYQMGNHNRLEKKYIASPTQEFNKALNKWQEKVGKPTKRGMQNYFVEDLYQIDDVIDFYKTVINRQKILLIVLLSEQKSLFGKDLIVEFRKNPFLVMDLISDKPIKATVNSSNDLVFIIMYLTSLNIGIIGRDYDSYLGATQVRVKLDHRPDREKW